MESSIFDNLLVRDPKDAFDNALRKGMKNPDDYMYMHSTRFKDYFKHRDSREYISYFNLFGKLIAMKEYKRLYLAANNSVEQVSASAHHLP